MLGADGKPLRDDAMRDSEGMTLVDGDTSQGTAYVSFERQHSIARYPFTRGTVRTTDRNGAVAGRRQGDERKSRHRGDDDHSRRHGSRGRWWPLPRGWPTRAAICAAG